MPVLRDRPYRQRDHRDIVKRPHLDTSLLNKSVETILNDVRQNGDKAVLQYEERFDHSVLSSLAVSEKEMEEANSLVSPQLKQALILAHENIAKFHSAQKFNGVKIETCDGVTCWQESRPIQKVGLYIPGGTAPLFSTVLMLATPAKIAGCEEIVLCTPPKRAMSLRPSILV